MRKKLLAAMLILSAPLSAAPSDHTKAAPPRVQRHWECVPIARALSGIQIFGDAHTWWRQAEGRFRRGNAPKRGAVLAFKPHGSMELGHVAAVSKIIDSRTILLTHSNWSLIGGRKGQIERNVKAIDVSSGNDWSRVRVWFAPLGDLGTTLWPTHGFIYPNDIPPMTIPTNARYANSKVIDLPKPTALMTPPKTANLDAKLPKSEGKSAKGDKTESASNVPTPTGRISYLGKMLKKLK